MNFFKMGNNCTWFYEGTYPNVDYDYLFAVKCILISLLAMTAGQCTMAEQLTYPWLRILTVLGSSYNLDFFSVVM